MVEPVTLAVVGTVALTEGIRFLYTQAGEILKRWNDRRDAAESGVPQPHATEAVHIQLPNAFEGQLSEPKIHFDALDRLENDLLQTRKSLSGYADGVEKVDSNNMDLLVRTDALRRLLEATLQERITFKGEKRQPSDQWWKDTSMWMWSQDTPLPFVQEELLADVSGMGHG